MIGRTNATVGMASEYEGMEYCEINIAYLAIDASINKNFRASLPYADYFGSMFSGAKFKSIELNDLRTGDLSFFRALRFNRYLTTLVLSGNNTSITDFGECFTSDTALTNVTFTGVVVKSSVSFSATSLLTSDSLANILTSLYDFRSAGDTTTTCTLTLHATTKATLTPEQTATANAKGWTIA